MFQVNQLSGFGGGGEPLSLTYKGHGRVFVETGAGDTTMNYGTVLGGSAPAAGDLVCWHWLANDSYDTSPVEDDRRNDLTGLGWVQNNQPAIIGAVDAVEMKASTMLAKVVTSGDLSSPAVFMEDTTFANSFMNWGFWVAFSVVGTVASLTIPTHVRNVGGGTNETNAPTSIPVDSSALNPPAAAVTFGWGTGTDDSPTLAGVTWDVELTQNNFGQYFDTTLDIRAGYKLDVGGASYTVSKSDDGQANALAAGYISIS